MYKNALNPALALAGLCMVAVHCFTTSPSGPGSGGAPIYPPSYQTETYQYTDQGGIITASRPATTITRTHCVGDSLVSEQTTSTPYTEQMPYSLCRAATLKYPWIL